MAWEVVFTDEFGEWWDGLTMEEHVSVAHDVEILRVYGVDLSYPRRRGFRRASTHTCASRESSIRGAHTASFTHSIHSARRSC
jgi:hypothetical protein